ncbi:MAG TPA: DNA polymerase I [Stellaceae bacterium]|nr:DNA polymerase I [Stellaceae bacterium]
MPDTPHSHTTPGTAAPDGSTPNLALKHLTLIDGSGFIFRAFHALPPLNRADGTPINAVLGFCNMLQKVIDESDSDHIAVIFDASRLTFRNRIYPEYKAQRPPPPPELIPQFALVREATEAFNVAQVEMEDYEADDLIATYARLGAEAGAKVTILSSDKDLMQLVTEVVGMHDPIRNRAIGAPEVREKFGVDPAHVIDVQALCGDKVDNVPGVPGIGVKTAAELIGTYGDLETLLVRAPEIKQPKRRQSLIDFAEQARVSRKLVELCTTVPVPLGLESMVRRPIEGVKLLEFLRANGFRQLATRMEQRHPAGSGQGAPHAPAIHTGTSGNVASPSSDAPHDAPLPRSAMVVPEPRQAVVEKAEYTLVQDLADLEAWIARINLAGAVAIDTETNSLDAVAADLVGISLAIEPGQACYIPVGHVGAEDGQLDFGMAEKPKQIPLEAALARLKPLLESSDVLKIAHNAKYDVQVFGNYGIDLKPLDCTMLLANTLEAGAHGMGLDELAQLYFDHKMIAYKDVAGSGKSHKGFAAVPLDKACEYAAEDADYALRLHRILKPRVLRERLSTLYETIERPMVPTVASMERHGIAVDRTALQKLSIDFGARMAALEIEIHELAGGPFNIGSPKQLGEILFDKLQLPGGKKGKTGAYGTDAALLEQLAAQHELPRRVLDWRQLAKLKSTYADALVEQINPKTGRVHTQYSLAGAATGRLASTDPNLQNIPVRTEEGRKIRRAFIAEPGNVLLSADYSQIELRLAAHVAGVEALKRAFVDGLDIHAMTASEMFGVPIEGMDPMIRRRAKAINFGIIYGISAFGLAAQLSIPQGEASSYIGTYFARFPELREYMDAMKTQAREKGYVETLFGRRCHLPGIKDANPARRAFSERAAINAPLQGTAADIIKRAMNRLHKDLPSSGLKARMLLQVHDELVFEVPEGEVEQSAALIKSIMENACAPVLQLSVPLVVETGNAVSWDAAH